MTQVTTDNSQAPQAGMLTVATSRFGEIKVSQDKIITLSSPFLGFPDSKRFMIKPHGDESPFMWLQSLDDPKLAFVVIQASILIPQFTPTIPAGTRKELDAGENAPLDILLILTIPKDNPQKMTANLLGPVVLNAEKRLAKQVLQDPTLYNACWPVFSEETE